MKKLNQFIKEGLKVSTKSKIKDSYDPDYLDEGQKEMLYDDTDYEDEDEQNVAWNDCNRILIKIDKDIDGFLLMKNFISKSKNIENDYKDIFKYLEDCKDEVVTGNDYGYAFRLNNGHLEIDCINSGSRGTYYIYGLSKEGYELIDDWQQGEVEDKTLEEILYQQGVIEPILINTYV